MTAPTATTSAATATSRSATRVTWRITPRVVALATTAALATLAAAATGDVALLTFAAPLGLAAVLGLTRRRPSPPVIETTVEPLITSPFEPVHVTVSLTTEASQICEVIISLPKGVRCDSPPRWTVRQRAGETTRLECVVRATRPGRFEIGNLEFRITDLSGCLEATGKAGTPVIIEARPQMLVLKSLVRPERVRATAGDRVSRLVGDGIEFAEVREQAAGARGRRINWRATARRNVTCVNTYHPERSTDIVLLADTFSESQIPAVVSTGINLAEAHLKRHDRVGLVAFGGVLDWVDSGTGPHQLERIRRSLLSSEAFFSYAQKTADVIPRRLFPAGCLVIAISPLGDDRFNGAVASLRMRGLDIAVVEIAPPHGGVSEILSVSLAWRIAMMERDALRGHFWRIGVPVIGIGGNEDLAGALSEIAAFRRTIRTRPVPRR